MKEKALQIFSGILLLLFLINIPNIFNYEKEDSLGITGNNSYEENFEEDLEFNINRYEKLISIEDVSLTTGITVSDLEFSQPDKLDGEKLSEEDNKTLFFFGSIDPITEEQVTENGDWGDWGGDPNIDTGEVEQHQNNQNNRGDVNVGQPSTPQQTETETDNTPYEVTLDKFLGN